MPDEQPSGMWDVYCRKLQDTYDKWTEGEIPPVVAAVAAATGIDPVRLHDEVEGSLGMDSCDDGYEYTVWHVAWAMKGYPDWVKAPGGDQGH